MKRRVLITGATGGLGRAFVWEFASRGWDVVLTDTDEARLAILAASVAGAHGVRARYYACDLASDEERTHLISMFREDRLEFGALVNVAGFDLEGSFLNASWSGLQSLMRVNMESGFLLTHAIVSLRSDWEPLRVINTASLAAYFPMPYKALYAASKRFILNASLALREELGTRATITVLCPAGMPTTPSSIEAIANQRLIGRLTTMNTSDVARMTLDAALKGKAIVVPGFINRLMLAFSRLLPATVLARLLGRRWGSAQGHDSLRANPQAQRPAIAVEEYAR